MLPLIEPPDLHSFFRLNYTPFKIQTQKFDLSNVNYSNVKSPIPSSFDMLRNYIFFLKS